MKDINELRIRKGILVAEARKFDEGCTKDGRVMTGEEQDKYQKMVDDIRALEQSIKREEELQEMEMRSAPEVLAGDDQPNNNRVFASLGDQLLAVARASKPGGNVDPRLMRAATGMSEMVDSEGGFMVEQDFLPELLKDVYNSSELANRCYKVPIGAGKNGLYYKYVDETSRADGSRAGGIRAYWEGEADTATATKPKLGRGQLILNKVLAFCYATDELLDDAAALEGIIKREFPMEVQFKLQDAIVNGDGVGKPLGLVNSDALVSITKETGQAADTILTENILKMWRSMPGNARGRAIWIYNQELEDQLETLHYAIGTGGVLIKLFTPNNNGGGTMKGRPAIPIEQCPGAGDVGDIMCVDPSQYLLIDKDGIKADTSIHVQFLYGETVFRFTYRCNGQPMRKTKITPYKRTDSNFYMSPYVAVAAR